MSYETHGDGVNQHGGYCDHTVANAHPRPHTTVSASFVSYRSGGLTPPAGPWGLRQAHIPAVVFSCLKKAVGLFPF